MESRKKRSAALPVPHESIEQRHLFEWAALQQRTYPALQLMYHVPNEGKRTWKNGARMKSEGLRAGVPDICLPTARGKYHGLYIELKRRDRNMSRTSTNQHWWITELQIQGYYACVCYGWESAVNTIKAYLNGGALDE